MIRHHTRRLSLILSAASITTVLQGTEVSAQTIFPDLIQPPPAAEQLPAQWSGAATSITAQSSPPPITITRTNQSFRDPSDAASNHLPIGVKYENGSVTKINFGPLSFALTSTPNNQTHSRLGIHGRGLHHNTSSRSAIRVELNGAPNYPAFSVNSRGGVGVRLGFKF